jgi:hypothetical protein
MKNFIQHKNFDISFHYQNCTVYAVAFDRNAVGLYVRTDLAQETPVGAVVYLIRDVINFDSSDKILYEGETPVVLRGNGDKEMLPHGWERLAVYRFESGNDNTAAICRVYEQMATKFIAENFLYYNEHLPMRTFYGRKCLWIMRPEQRSLPHMEFVGGYPNEWCVFLDSLTDKDKQHLTYWNGDAIDFAKLTEKPLDK